MVQIFIILKHIHIQLIGGRGGGVVLHNKSKENVNMIEDFLCIVLPMHTVARVRLN